MLSLPTVLGSEPNDLLVESMPDKQVITGGNSDPSGMRFVSGKKRSFVESTPTVQSLNSVESFGMILSKRTSESIPDDDDLLSSILVGRRSSGLKIKPTPAAPEVASVKRPCSAHRGSATKRKVLMDDMMVLHGETIRQQLTNTEDIRRVRKKAPCSNHDILMIQRQFLDEEIIREPIFTGMSSELIFLHGETFDLNGVKVSENDPCKAFSESAKDRESHSRTNFAVEYGMVKNSEHHVVQNNVEGQSADLTVLTDSCEAEINVLSHDINTLGQPKVIFDVKELETFHHVEMDIDRENSDVPKSSSPAAHVIGEDRSDDFSAQPDISDKTNDVYGSLQKDEKSMLPADTLETLPIMEYEIGAVASEIAEHTVEIRAQGQTDCSEPTNNLSASAATTFMETFECNSMSSVNGDETLKENKNSKTGGGKEDETPGLSLVCDDKDLTSSCTYSKETEIDSLHSVGLDLDAKDTFLKGEENPVFQEAGPRSTVDADISAVQHPPADDNVDDVMVANDTGFLNVDDDEVIEDDDYDMPCSEGTYLENSGWSSRTRAVARYLQGLFGKDTLHGRKNVPLDHLLAGKTRKEASRMFFETLVLKTRDYVHVEQMKPFESLNMLSCTFTAQRSVKDNDIQSSFIYLRIS
ncbi:sister chromatid cohesion 1 protein 4-like [Quillaja saponaria]|uniref:Sister chromatid cohesion 1 protein 4-like n=1 Tax=Quillaja saponaria TaxID=32244 RepID=A0AAD7QCF2_QUISA|nr:sister chromatid cohesion 1 protein 4-like [Quillaja saponaria]